MPRVHAVPITPRRVALSSATLILENALRLGLTAVVSFWIARSLGPAQFGILNFASALLAIFLSVAALGLEIPLVLRLAQGQSPGALLAAALWLRLGAALAALGSCVAIAFALQASNPQALAVTLIVSLALLGYVPSVFDCWFKANVEAAAPALVRLTATLLSLAAKVACLALGGDVIALAWTVAFEALVYGVLMSAAWCKSVAGQRHLLRLPERAQVWQLLRDSLPYLISISATVLAMKIDVVMLGVLSTPAQTGVYSLVQKLSETLYVLPVALMDSAYPPLARKTIEAPAAAIAPGQLLFFGTDYEAAIPLFHLHAWTCIGVALHAARHRWMATLGLQRYAPAVTIAGAAISVALNAVLIPRFGAYGAAWAALVSSFASGLAASFLIRELRPLGMLQLKALWPWHRLQLQFVQMRREHRRSS